MTINGSAVVLMMVALAVIIVWQNNRIVKLERAVKWFATHIRIDDRDLEKTPPPDDLAELIEGLDDME